MKINKLLLIGVTLGLMLITFSTTHIVISSAFESGSIGETQQNDINSFTLAVRDDNFNESLPAKWRSWWYFQVHDTTEQQSKININIDHRGWKYFYLPFYSYDNKTWHRMNEHHVMQSTECEQGIKNCVLSLSKTLKNHQVSLAFFIPYTVSQLNDYLSKISNHPAVAIETLGYSPYFNLPIQHIEITDPTSTSQKARIWIQARTHPGETPSNFVLEGLIDFLLSEDLIAQSIREQFIFHIVPMHNPDGVFKGNYRTTPDSKNLEISWFFDKNNPEFLLPKAPLENQLLHKVMQTLLAEEIPVKIALNLHATNGEPDEAAFAFPHFGDNPNKYTSEQINLWNNQLIFINHLTQFYENRIEPPPPEGYGDFLNRYHPETWWWYNTQDKVMALTVEATYGKAGYDHWISDVEHRDLGKALAKTIATYLELEHAH